jgi:hypothetical protein
MILMMKANEDREEKIKMMRIRRILIEMLLVRMLL